MKQDLRKCHLDLRAHLLRASQPLRGQDPGSDWPEDGAAQIKDLYEILSLDTQNLSFLSLIVNQAAALISEGQLD